MSDDLHEDFVLQLASLPIHPGDDKNGPRRVATPEGAKFYGQPIGTIITPDLLAKIHAEKGSAPKGATAPVKQGSAPHAGSTSSPSTSGAPSKVPGKAGNPVAGNKYTQSGYQAPGIDSTPPDWITNPPPAPPVPQMALGIKPSSIDGPNKFSVGGSKYTAPSGSRLISPKSGSGVSIVLTPDGDIHFFTEKGEVEADDAIKTVLKERFGKKVKPDDSLYVESDFDGVDGLSNMQVGQHLHDKAGNKIFTKTEKGFVHSDLGVPVEEKDIKPLHDSGELTTKPKPVAEEDIKGFDFGDDNENEISFASMSPEEFDAYLNTTDPGDKLYFSATAIHSINGESANSKEGPQEYKTVTKLDSDKWQVDGAPSTLAQSSLFYVKNQLRTIEPKDLKPYGTWSAGEKEKDDAKASADKVKLDAQKVKDDASEAAKKAISDEAAKKKKASDEIKAAEDAKIQSDVDSALKESQAYYSELNALSQMDQKKLKEAELGTTTSPWFEKKALPGSQVYFSTTGETWERQSAPGEWKQLGTSHTLQGSQLFSASSTSTLPGRIIKKNTFTDDVAEWTPWNEGSRNKVGDYPTLEWLTNSPIGSIVSDETGFIYKNPSGNWVESFYPQGVNQELSTEAALGYLKIHKIGSGDASEIMVGTSLNGPDALTNIYAKALPGTKVSYFDSPGSSAKNHVMTLSESGVWESSKSTIPDSYVLATGGYVSFVPEGPSEKPLGVGDTPTVAWMEHAPVGTGIIDNELGTIFVKKDSGLWGQPGGSGTLAPANFGHLDYSIGDPNENWESHTPESKNGAVASYQDVLDAPMGTKFHYHKNDGSITNYSKVDDNTVLTPSGAQLPISTWKKSVASGKVTFNGEPIAAPEADDLDLGVPEPLVAPTGDQKQDAKEFNEFTEELADWEKELLNWDAPTEQSLAQVVEDIHEPTVSVVDPASGVAMYFTPLEVHAAIDALQSHSHGSPVYGLKQLPDDNEIKKNQAQIIAAAKNQYPKSSPKKALLSLLKNKIGADQSEDDLNEKNDPTIHLGKEKPTKNPFGVTGGDYTQSDIDSAIAIIEDYDGKLYKSQLTKADNPLGELDFNTLVGANKDKLQQKKDVIDFLKKQVNGLDAVQLNTEKDLTSEQSLNDSDGSKDTLPAINELDLPLLLVGTKLTYTYNKGNKTLITKETDGSWWDSSGNLFPNYLVVDAAETGRLHLFSIAPPVGTGPDKVSSKEEFVSLPIGTTVYHQGIENHIYTKVEHNNWELPGFEDPYFDDDFSHGVSVGKIYIVSKPETIPPQYTAAPAVQSKVTPDNDDLITIPNHDIAPGFYKHKNGMSLSVFEDGTGVVGYGDSPDSANLTSEDVSALHLNFENWTYNGVPNGSSNVSVAEPKAKKAATTPAVKVDPKKIPNGNYFIGDPNDPDTVVWNVKDGVVQQHGTDGEVTPVSATKLKNAALKGALVNKWGNTAFLPEGHIGTVQFLSRNTSTESLKSLRLALDNQYFTVDDTASTRTLLAAYGVYVNGSTLNNYVQVHHGSMPVADATKLSLKEAIDGIIGPEDSWPFHDIEVESIHNFEWYEGTGKAKIPDYFAKHITGIYSHEMLTNSQATAIIKEAGKNFGDGQTIGQHVSGMKIWAKRAWIKAFMDGNFQKMYNLEVDAAIKQDTSHSSGWKHPGYPDNSFTHSVKWGPAVSGEKSVHDEVAGDWSSVGSELTNEWVDNYIIAASMQHPTHLTTSERKMWVARHLAKNKFGVDALSLKAQQSALAGNAPLTPEPVWTDDIQSPKAYNSFFDSTPYPVTQWVQDYSGNAATEWVEDFQSGKVKVVGPSGEEVSYDKEFLPLLEQTMHDNPYAIPSSLKKKAVLGFFEGLQGKAAEKDLQPVYTLAPTQNVKQSKHPIYNYTDQFGNKYLFKPAANDENGAKYRADVEAEANNISRFFGSNAPKAQVITLDGKVGSIQAEVPHIKTLSGFNWATADEKQTIDLAHEHMIDWMLDQDDNWAPNTLIGADGHLIGIDKGRAFMNYGNWNGMVSHSGMDVNTHVVYSDLYQAIQNKQISKEVADATWLAAQRRAQKMSKADEGALLEMLHAATDSRKSWTVNYSIDGKKVPQTQQGFFDAFMDRKSKLPSQIEELWKDIYAKAGYGDLPEPKKSFLGENQHSGLDDSSLHSTVLTVGSVGTSTLLGSPDLIGGTATLWGHKNSDGSKDINAQMYLAPQKQADVLSWFKSNSDANSLSKENAATGEFTYDDKFAPMVSAAKTIGAHAEDGSYNESTLANYSQVKDSMLKDLEFWKPGMLPEDGQDFVSFPSGTKVDFGHVDQYKMMLEYYNSKTGILDEALASKSKPKDTITKFSAIPLHESGVVYLDGNGQKLVKLSNGKWVYVNSNITAIIDDTEAESMYKDPGQVWNKWKDEPESPKVVFKAVLGSTHEQQGEYSDFELSLTGTHLDGGNDGNEYEVSLPTGEKIYFRNSNFTNTARGHEGRITVRVPGAKNDTDVANGMSNAQAWLEDNLGLNLDSADHDSAELLYWREMYGILENRRHKAGSKWAKAKADLDEKIFELDGDRKHFLENFAKKNSVAEQNEFFRDLWGKHFGKDKVNALIDSEGYLPYYENHDLRHTDLITGKPNWVRFDVDLEEFKAKDMMLASSARSGTHTLDAVKSGGAYSTEERTRLFGKWMTGMSSGTDQSYGSSNSIFTRLFSTKKHSGLSFIYNPRAMLRTRTYSFDQDRYGKLDARKLSAPSNPLEAWTEFTGSSNETMIPNAAGLFGDLDAVIFENAQMLNAAIQELKKLGITEIRGVPIEDRLILRANLASAIQKLKETWYKK
jgi:hypothetical protein